MDTPIERLIAVAREIQREGKDDNAVKGGYVIHPRLIGRLDCALADIHQCGVCGQAIDPARSPECGCKS